VVSAVFKGDKTQLIADNVAVAVVIFEISDDRRCLKWQLGSSQVFTKALKT
jgi:hypothetical protein